MLHERTLLCLRYGVKAARGAEFVVRASLWWFSLADPEWPQKCRVESLDFLKLHQPAKMLCEEAYRRCIDMCH